MLTSEYTNYYMLVLVITLWVLFHILLPPFVCFLAHLLWSPVSHQLITSCVFKSLSPPSLCHFVCSVLTFCSCISLFHLPDGRSLFSIPGKSSFFGFKMPLSSFHRNECVSRLNVTSSIGWTSHIIDHFNVVTDKEEAIYFLCCI